MRKELKEKNGIVDAEKYLSEYVNKLDPSEIASQFGYSLEEAEYAVELLKKNKDFRHLSLMTSKK